MFCTLGIVPKIEFYLKADVRGLRFFMFLKSWKTLKKLQLYVFSDSFDTDWSILLSIHKKIRWACVRSILMPQTYHIAHLNGYARKISGVPLILTWCQ